MRLLFLPLLLLIGTAGARSAPAALIGGRAAVATDFVDAVARNDFEGAVQRFDATMKRVLPPARLKEVWQGLVAQMGPYRRRVGVRTQKGAQFEFIFVTCEFAKARVDAKVVLDADARITGLWFVPSQATAYRPPRYVRQQSFVERAVTIGKGKWALPGTLTVPSGAGPFPAVVLVHGSGPQDRDETIGPNMPFRDLAWGLASQGIAVLRYDKRTKTHPQQFARTANRFTVNDEVVEDAVAAVVLLKKTPSVARNRVFVLGHSLGGMMAPRIAGRSGGVAGLIILAGATRPPADAILEQVRYAARLRGKLSEADRRELARIERQVARAKDPKLTADTPASELPFAVPASYWLDLRRYSPTAEAARLSCPMLILQGGRDYQVTRADFQGWRRALARRRGVTFKLYPKLNHLFMEGVGRSTPDEYLREGHVAETVVSDIAAWIRAQ